MAGTRTLLALALLALTPAAAAASPAVTEPADLVAPGSGLATGADGALWVSLPSANKVARVTTAGAVTYVSVPRMPTGMAAGPDGALWVVQQGIKGRGVARITTGGAVTSFPGLTGLPTAIAAGPDGNLWVTEQDASFTGASIGAAVTRVTPAGAATEFRAGGHDPIAITAGPDGALWFTTEETIGRATTAGNVSHFEPDVLASEEPAGITSGAGGLWFAADEAVDRIAGEDAGRISGQAAFQKATAIAAGPDGAIWFTAKDAIGRVTPDGTITLHNDPLIVGNPGTGIAAGPDGAMWFTELEGKLGRITVPPFVGDVAVAGTDETATTVTAGVRANALQATARLEVRDAAGTPVAQASVEVPAGVTTTPVQFSVDGLRPGSFYTATVSASSAAGDALAVDVAFTTLPPASTPVAVSTPTPTAAPDPTPAPDDDSPPAAEPVPVLTETVVLSAARGEVRVRAPGGDGFVAVENAATIPLGALVDTRRGEVRLRSALADGTVQTGFFRGGLFRVRQGGGGATKVLLAGRLDCRRPAARMTATVSRKRKGKRKVWGRDDGGSFETHGRDSVATVRGTEWLTMDTCAGTLTRVKEGAVSVRPKRGGRARLVRAGQHLLVPHR